MLMTASLQPGARICHLADLIRADERRGNVFRNQGYGVLEQVQVSGPCQRLRAAVCIELAVEVVDMGLDGAHTDE
jgi:hypothetical protein